MKSFKSVLFSFILIKSVQAQNKTNTSERMEPILKYEV